MLATLGRCRCAAVVATELRRLAQRSADAAKQIESPIATSVERVEQGTQQVDAAGETMRAVAVFRLDARAH